MKAKSLLKPFAALAGAAALLLGAGAAQAHGDNIYWSIGVGSPGVHVGVASAPPVVAYPPVVYMPPPRPVIYAPVAPVVYGPPPGWRHHHHRGWERGYAYGGRGYERFEHEREGRRGWGRD